MASRSPIDRLKHHLLASLGVSPALLLGACSSQPPADDDAGVTTNQSTSATTTDDTDGNDGDATSDGTGIPPNPTTGVTTSPDSGDGDPGDGDPGDGDPGDGDPGDGDPGIKFDVAGPDYPPFDDCTVFQTEPATLDEFPECQIMLDEGFCWSNLYWGCIDPEPGQTCAEACVDGNCLADWTNCSGDPVDEVPLEFCGPYEIDGMCCTLAEITNPCAPGE